MTRFFDDSASERAARANRGPQHEPRHRIAVIGTGMMGREHMRVATGLGRARVHGIYDEHAASLDRAEAEFAQYAGHPLRRYDSLESACEDPALDAIVLATPNHTHFPLVKRLLGSGKALMIEKPMATLLPDAAAMARAARKHGAVFQLGMQYRFKAQYVEAFRAALGESALGEIHSIAMAEYRPPFLDKVGQWNKFNEYSGGTLVEKCCHYFDLINCAARAAPERVYASGGRAVNFRDFRQDGRASDIDDHAFVVIDYRNGVRASFTLNMFCQELHEELVICGSRGRLVATEGASFRHAGPSTATLQVEVADHPRYRPQPVAYPEAVESSGHYGATWFAHEAFMDRIEGKAGDGATAAQGLGAIIVAAAAQQSMASGKPVDIADFLRAEDLAWPDIYPPPAPPQEQTA